MYFKAGSFAFETGEVQLKNFQTGTLTRSDTVIVEKMTTILDVEFTIVRDTQAAITARFNQIWNAVSRDGIDVGFYQDDGAKSAIFIDSSKTLSGTMVTQLPSVIPEDGADYCTHLKGSFGFMAEYLPSFAPGGGGGPRGSTVTGYREQISVRGDGGPRRAVDVVDRGPPRIYILADRTPVLAQQTGSVDIIANSGFYPEPNAPLWPKLLDSEQTEIVKNLEPQGDGSFRASVGWSYQFLSDGPLFGVPRVRR